MGSSELEPPPDAPPTLDREFEPGDPEPGDPEPRDPERHLLLWDGD